jgi:hypothetical protein
VPRIQFAFCVHNHQPTGNLQFVFEKAYDLAYRPFLETVERQPSAKPEHDWNSRIARECYIPNSQARIVDVSSSTLMLEATGEPDKLAKFLEVLRPFGIKEQARTGVVSMSRGAKILNQRPGVLCGSGQAEATQALSASDPKASKSDSAGQKKRCGAG